MTETKIKDKWAILIGVQGYERVRPLRYSQNDVVELGKAFRDDLGFPPDHVLEFHEGEGAKTPDLDTIFHETGKLRDSREVAPDDLLVFYFSGHGMQHQDKDYLLPIGASDHNLRRTGIRVADIVEDLKDTGCDNLVMFVDACRDVVEGGKGLLSIGEDSKSAVSRAGIVTFFSCDPKDRSFEIEQIEHGSFTHCVLNSIRQKRRTTVAQLADYLRKEVPRVNIGFDKPKQIPYAIIEPSSKGRLAVFFNPDWGEPEWDPDPYALRDAVVALYGQEQISAKYFNKAVKAIRCAKEGSPDPRKLRALRDLCSGELSRDAFELAWEAFHRVLSGPAPRGELGEMGEPPTEPNDGHT